MRLYLAAACAAVLLCTACGSNTPSLTAMTSPPLARATASETLDPFPTPIPSVIALASNVPLGSLSPGLQPTPPIVAAPASPPAPADPDLLFADDTIGVQSDWRQLNVRKASFAIESGTLASTYAKKGSWAYAVRELARPDTVVRVGGRFTSSGLGYFGWLCGDSSTGRYYGAVPETDGSLVFIDGGYAGVEPLERYEDLGEPITNGAVTVMGLECTIDHGTLWLQALLADGDPIAMHVEEVEDVSHFDVVGMYGEALEAGFTMAVDQITARGTGGATGSLAFDDIQLADYVTAALPGDCQEAPRSGAERAAVECYWQDEGPGPELVRVARYDDADGLRDAFEAQTSGPACPGAPTETPWSRGITKCVVDDVGIGLSWTDDGLDQMATLVDLEGDYSSTDASLGVILGAR